MLEAVRRVRDQGYRIALDDFRPGPRMDALVEFADLVKVEMETPREKQEVLLRDLHARGIRVVSEKVETDADFRWALRAGYDYFQGNFFAVPW